MTSRTLSALIGLSVATLVSGAALAQTTPPASSTPPMPMTDTSTPPAKPAKAMKAHHSVTVVKHGRTFGAGREPSTDALNQQSLSAAQAGQGFAPAAPMTDAPAKKM